MAGKGWTFQSLIDGKMQVSAYCNVAACGHTKTLDLEKLRDRFGSDATAMEWDLRPRLRCEKCKSKDVGLIYAPDSSKISCMGQNLYSPPKNRRKHRAAET
ncbi:hypothetical protein [Mesorhizobium sp. M7A.F.Ca.US.008.03.1.1]|uniref:hypothetical protein n=1 Tax=Mesorhizobium sp. M7A.F.Ca.US.008.03.1.1 TaxID=2496742 RepID=UPI000FCB0326|nr:hypothetical protein [Mesorhizobium sp. M7A.F.Ca.US.008.03.1.1]RUW61139.1 hypothetical protein EOA16_15265 [Mesorhizobium sp. M7A.F.Ca.US.008.03.1.1]